MKVKPKQQILFYDGQPLLNENKEPVLLRDVVINAINAVDQEDTDKSKVFELSLKMYQEEEVELSAQDCEFILKKAEKALIPVAYGRLKEIIT